MSDGEKTGGPGDHADERTPAPIRAMRVIALSRDSRPAGPPVESPLPTFEDQSAPAWSPPEAAPISPPSPPSPLPSFADELGDELTPVYVKPTADARTASSPPPGSRSSLPPGPTSVPPPPDLIEAIPEVFADDAEESNPRLSPIPVFHQPDEFEPISGRPEEIEAELEDVEPTPMAPSYEPRSEDFPSAPVSAPPSRREGSRSIPPAAAPPAAVAPAASPSGPQDRPPPPKRTPQQAPPQGARPALPTAKMKKKPWWEEVFGDDFSRSYRSPTPAQIEYEVSFMERALALSKGSVVLDLACGQGEYAVELGRRGYSVVGYDLSVFQLAMAADRAQAASQRINFLQGDMREMAFESMFDAIVSWNTSFGYFEEDRNTDVLRRMYSALRPGGVLLLEIQNRDYAAREAPISNWYEGDGCICMDDMSLDFITSRLTVKRSVILDDGRSKEVTYSVRLYCLSEIGKLFNDVGFVVQSVSGSPSTPGAFLGSNSPSLIIRAERPVSGGS